MSALFRRELSLVGSVEKTLEDLPSRSSELSADFQALSSSYRELLSMVMKLTSISDALQLKLRQTKGELSQSVKEVQRLNRSLKALNQEKSEILALTAHDLRSPLSGIHGLAELISSGEIDPEESAVFAGEIVATTNEMFSMVSQLLEIYRGDSSLKTSDEHWQKIALGELLSLIEDFPRPNAARKRIVLQFECDEPSRELFVESGLFSRVAENLLSNAVKFSSPGAMVYLALRRDGDCVALQVRDTGPGISKEDQEKLFTKTERLSSKPTDGEISAGLGLTIVHRILRHIGGRIWCESALGQGATFHVHFPARFL